ncbi:hypothetical protein C8R45DRAFT_487352 [Mycena sanguinolenta]|nr:hypothetical protein C8R45DRAFT_487352 [Mycena sanguinolenta]
MASRPRGCCENSSLLCLIKSVCLSLLMARVQPFIKHSDPPQVTGSLRSLRFRSPGTRAWLNFARFDRLVRYTSTNTPICRWGSREGINFGDDYHGAVSRSSLSKRLSTSALCYVQIPYIVGSSRSSEARPFEYTNRMQDNEHTTYKSVRRKSRLGFDL